jgi:hypothetical protein
MSKNLCGKSRTKDKPYEIWQCGGWTWKVLKKYQSPEKETENQYARWFCFVSSPLCPDGELGDTYVKDIKSVATRTYVDPSIES